MTRDQIETLVRLVEDIGFALGAFEALQSNNGCSGNLFHLAKERLEHSHSAITEIFTAEKKREEA